MTLAKNRAIDRFRSGYLERGRRVPLEEAARLPGREETPEQYSAGQERQRLVQEALARSPWRQRQAIAAGLLRLESERNCRISSSCRWGR